MNSRAVTLMEILIVVVLIATIAGFSVVSYRKSVLKARERDAVLNLTVIHGASQIYRAKNASYWDTGGNTINDLNVINQELQISIASTDTAYSYESDIDHQPDRFTAYATWNLSETDEFRLRVNEGLISDTNPCCDLGNCPSRPACL